MFQKLFLKTHLYRKLDFSFFYIGGQAPFVIPDPVTTTRLGFARLRQRVNVACSHGMHGLMIVGDSIFPVSRHRIVWRQRWSYAPNRSGTRRSPITPDFHSGYSHAGEAWSEGQGNRPRRRRRKTTPRTMGRRSEDLRGIQRGDQLQERNLGWGARKTKTRVGKD